MLKKYVISEFLLSTPGRIRLLSTEIGKASSGTGLENSISSSSLDILSLKSSGGVLNMLSLRHQSGDVE